MRLLFCSNSISAYYRRHFHTGGDFAPEITHLVAYLLRHRDHASVRLPGVLQTNVGHSNFRCVIKKNHI